MAKLTHGSSSFTGSTTQTTKEKKYTFSTGGKYVDKNIEFTITAQSGSATTPTASGASTSTSLSGTTLTVARSVTPTVSAGWVTSGTAGTVTITGTVPTQTKTVTPSTSTQTISPDTGKLLSSVTVNAMSNGAYGDNITTTTTTTYPQLIKTAGYMTTKRIQKVKVVAGQTFQIEVPNGSASNTIVFTFTVDANNNVTVT